ncbi:MAG: adenine nucleotide alpha hydrolase [Proteobacteria bacterium]|nr:adenine nucleotide alpha hydrolase [Pseudomonadota bacterium]
MTKKRVLLSWSSGKDSAWCLHALRQDAQVEVAGLLTTFNRTAGRVAMHAVRRSLVEAQAEAANLPLHAVDLPWPCPNEAYESAMRNAMEPLRTAIDAVAFGDLFLEDIRAYRESKMRPLNLEPLFPLWQQETGPLARTMIESGLKAVLTCVDPKQCPAGFAGRRFDTDLLERLPGNVDPCGENGEFHTFVTAGPMFSHDVNVTVGETLTREGFVFADLHPAEGPRHQSPGFQS